jgi:hypothetical protein
MGAYLQAIMAVGTGLGFLLGVWAFIVADSVGGRIFIVAAMIIIFLIRVVWSSFTGMIVTFLGWMIFAVSCYIFLKLRGVGLP